MAMASASYASQSESVAFFKERLTDTRATTDTRIAYCDSILKYEPDNANAMLNKASLLYGKRNLAESVVLLQNLYDRHFNSLNIQDKCRLLNLLYERLYDSGKTKSYLEIAKQLLHLDKPDSLKHYDFYIYVSIFDKWMKFGRTKEAAKYLRIEDNLLKQFRQTDISPKWIKQMTWTLYCDSMIYANSTGDIQKALTYGLKAKAYCASHSDSVALSGNLATIYSMLDRHDIAGTYFNEIFSNSRKSDMTGMAAINYIDHLNRTGQSGKALTIAEKYEDDIRKQFYGDWIWSLFLKNRSMSLALSGDFETAFNMMGTSKEYTDSILSAEQLSLSLADFEDAMTDTEMEQIGAGKTRWQRFAIGLCAGCLVLTAIVFLIVKRNRRLHERQQQMDAQIAENIEQMRRTSEEYQADRQGRQRELAQLTMNLNNMSGAMSRLQRIISDKNTDDSHKIEEARAVFREMGTIEDVSEVARLFFEEANETFFSNLYSRHPDITKGETRLCSYLMMNMSYKEIAALTHRSPRTIETTKYRLSKKFGLTDTPLDVYLRQFFTPAEKP